MPLALPTVSGKCLRVLAVLAAIAMALSACTTSNDADVRGAQAAPPGKYVSPGGNNANSGNSPAEPYKTLAFAVKQLGPGDTLYVMEGEYFENERPDSAVVINKSGTPDAWITVTAQPGATPVIRSNQSNGIKIEGASYVEVSNLELIGNPNGGTASYSGSGINADAIYGPAKNHHIRILGNKVSGFGAGGIPVTGSSHVEIRNNIVWEVAEVEWSQHSGISILESFNMGFGNDANGYSNYITGNVVYRVENKVRDRGGRFTDGNCIIMDRTKINGYTGRTLIANNVCLDNGGRGIQIFESQHVDVVNNTLYQNLRTGEIASSGGELGSFYSNDVQFANNLVFARNGLKPARAFDSSNIRFMNNLYVADTAPEYNGASQSGEKRVPPGSAVVANASTNPNPANFQLVSGSPAIDAGVGNFAKAVAVDFRGAARPSGGGVDVGAFEAGGSVAAAPTTAAPTTAAPSTTAAPASTGAPATTAAGSATSGPTTAPTTAAGGAGGGSGGGSNPTSTTLAAPSETVVPRPPTTAGGAERTAETVASAERTESTATTGAGPSTTGGQSTSTSGAGEGTTTSEPGASAPSEAGRVPAPLPQPAPGSVAGSSDSDAADAPTAPADTAPAGADDPTTTSTTGTSSTATSSTTSAGDLDGQAAGPLPFDDGPPQPAMPIELPLGALAAGLLTLNYYRPLKELVPARVKNRP